MGKFVTFHDKKNAPPLQLFENASISAKLVDMRSDYAGFEDLNAWPLSCKASLQFFCELQKI